MSVRLLSSDFVGSKLFRFMAKIEQTPRKLLHFENKQDAALSKSAKIVLSMSIFYVKDQQNWE